MPIYSFQNKNSGEEWTDIMSISEKEQFLESNPDIQQIITSMNIVGGVGTPQGDDGFNEVVDRIAAANPTSPLAASRGSKQSSKEVKTRQVIDKWKKKLGGSLTSS